MLLRKFSWEKDYYEFMPNHIGESHGGKPLNMDKQVPVKPSEAQGVGVHGHRAGAFKVRRKPINIDRVLFYFFLVFILDY